MVLRPGMTVREAGIDVARKIIQETAKAYYRKNPHTQYNVARPLTVVGDDKRMWPEGPLSCTNGMAPEQACRDINYSAVCRSFTADVYYDAFRFETPGIFCRSYSVDIMRYKDALIYKYGERLATLKTGRPVTTKDKELFLKTVREDLKPGDVFLATPNDPRFSGHVIMYVGDCFETGVEYIMHCWPLGGGRWDKNTGVNLREPYGAITLQTCDEFLFSVGSSPNWSLTRDYMEDIYLFRFTEMEEFLNAKLTDAAVTRYRYPDLVVEKTSSVGTYGTVLPGETLKITERFENKSAGDYSFEVREVIPEGTTFLKAEGATAVTEREVVWQVTVPAADFVEISYEVVVHTKPGDVIFFESGRADLMPTREFRVKTGASRLTEAEEEKLAAVRKKIPEALKPAVFEDLAYVKRLYRYLGREVSLPDTLDEYLKERYEVIKPCHWFPEVLALKKEPTAKGLEYAKMDVLRYTTGQYYFIPGDELFIKERAIDFLEDYFLPGDVMLSTWGENTLEAKDPAGIAVTVILGGGKVLVHSAEGTEILPFKDTVARALVLHFSGILRPTYAI